MLHSNLVVVGMSFKRRRNLAFGFSLSGIGGGLFVLAPLMQLTLDFYGPVGFFITLATSADVVTFGVMYFPSKLELYTQNMQKLEAKFNNSRDASSNSLKVYCKALFIKPIVWLCISMFAYGTGLYTIYLYLPTYIEETGFTGMQASFFLSLNGIISVVARLMTGAIATIKYVDEIWLYPGYMFVVALVTFIYPFISNSFVGQIVFASLIGLSSGSCYIMMTPVSIRFVGIKFVSASFGIQLFFCDIGSIVGPVCAGTSCLRRNSKFTLFQISRSGILVDNGGTYKQCFIIAAASILVAAISSASTIACISKPIESEYTDKHVNTEAGELLNVNERETNF
ncbi:monocarboxylate transporter 13-like [Mercenaria mercenaria]|uniref:monocarboxylate transporter 13-like n=1 Tax=Mercenaria mercenaria TaxID=6596 RepID=UPI00234E6EF5|nr:monocarboxylate transporter 13-like [Mercenaria mercenaria]